VSAEWALLAVQGPEALPRLGVDVVPFTFRTGEVLGVECLIAGTGYTGERGCELACAPDDAVRLWDGILEAGVIPCGLGARDTLRLEVCYPLHGNDITPERSPVEAGLAWACALDKDFPGVAVLRAQKEEGTAEKLVAFVMDDKGIPRQGMAIEEGGVVTSGSLSPMLERGIGLAYVDSQRAVPDTGVTIDLRGRPRAGHIVNKPIYRREES
jgi:aminomethyltransferase